MNLNENKFSIEDLFLCLANIIDEKNLNDSIPDVLDDENNDKIGRGLPSNVISNKKELLRSQLVDKKKKTSLCIKIENLKDSVKAGNDTETIRLLAQLINKVATDDQKEVIIAEMKFSEPRPKFYNGCSQIPYNRIPHQNEHIPEYNYQGYCQDPYNQMIPQNGTIIDYNVQGIPSNEYIVSRSAFPNNNNAFNAVNELNSITVMEENNIQIQEQEDLGLRYPLTRYNKSEQYLIKKGIDYSRIKLNQSFDLCNSSVIRELRNNMILYEILNTPTDEKSYVSNLVDQFPKTYKEVRNILREDRMALLKGPIFVKFAEKSLQSLHEFLKFLITIMDKVEVSRLCSLSVSDGQTVYEYIHKEVDPSMKKYGDQLRKFMHLHSQMSSSVSSGASPSSSAS